MAKKAKLISEQVRDAIEASGMSGYALARAAAIDESLLSKFRRGQSNLSLAAVDRLGGVLGLDIAVRRKPPKTKDR